MFTHDNPYPIFSVTQNVVYLPQTYSKTHTHKIKQLFFKFWSKRCVKTWLVTENENQMEITKQRFKKASP